MIPEDERQRRGEPVIVDGRIGTIEWGGVTRPASIYFESGGRVCASISEITPDPGGSRPVWKMVTRG